ncbi:MAG: 30S ribosome-binding factor RbfA [Planctomycetes bacterium]|nr:30S ribosome-binding factor RbfA [Planctomycetota bacterium]
MERPGPSRRAEKIARELQRALSAIIPYELTDPRIKNVTVTRVDPAPDLKRAKVFISVLGDDKERRRVIWGLIHAKRHIQAGLKKHVLLRYMPDLEFVYDESIAGSIRMVKLVESLVKKPAAEGEEAAAADGVAGAGGEGKADAGVDAKGGAEGNAGAAGKVDAAAQVDAEGGGADGETGEEE